MSFPISITIFVSTNLPRLLGPGRQLQNIRGKRFRGAFSISDRSGAHRIVDLRLGLAPSGSFGVAGTDWQREARMVGGHYLHAFAPNISPRESRSCGYVAGLVHDPGSLGWLRIAARSALAVHKSNFKHQTSNILVVVRLLHLARVRVSREGANRFDSPSHGRSDKVAGPTITTGKALRVCSRHRSDIGNHRALGSSGADSDTRGIFSRRDHASCRRKIIFDNGRPRGELVRNVSSAVAVLFRDHLSQFFSLVDQTAAADAKTAEQTRARGPRMRGATAAIRSTNT